MVVDRSSMSPQMQNLREASSDSTEAEGETAKRTAVLKCSIKPAWLPLVQLGGADETDWTRRDNAGIRQRERHRGRW